VHKWDVVPLLHYCLSLQVGRINPIAISIADRYGQNA
jgi:hypothetical protein